MRLNPWRARRASRERGEQRSQQPPVEDWDAAISTSPQTLPVEPPEPLPVAPADPPEGEGTTGPPTESQSADDQTSPTVDTAGDDTPEVTGSARTWTVTDQAVLAGLWIEQKGEQGEDADPLLELVSAESLLLGVFDGVGGAGAGRTESADDGLTHTGAWLASREARSATQRWAAQALGSGIDQRPTLMGQSLLEALTHDLQEFETRTHTTSRVSGTLKRSLPTTLAVAIVEAAPPRWHVTVLWAGDSRVFVLTPSKGLQQCTWDDSNAADALVSLTEDPVMTNLVSADGEFTIHDRYVEAATQSIVICASDGCFGYVATPAHFEFLLLSTMMTAATIEDWIASLADAIRHITSDDASLSMSVLGYATMNELKDSFAQRLDDLTAVHWVPFQDLPDGDFPALVACREASWATYRTTYEQLIADWGRTP